MLPQKREREEEGIEDNGDSIAIIRILDNIDDGVIIPNQCFWKNPNINPQYHFFQCMDKMSASNCLHNDALRHEETMEQYTQEVSDYLEYASNVEKKEFIHYYRQFEKRMHCLSIASKWYIETLEEEKEFFLI